jgi:hypothetical protein
MTATLERPGVVATVFVVIDADDYLDVRQPAWSVLEKAGAVEAQAGKVHVRPEAPEVLTALRRALPAKYPPPAGGDAG